ncbi:hypothetical protein EVG20_g8612 [Dentipellis fragilis]|uniref:Deoxyribonuclease NucA/NucB domain-containing protein n=1 Tax=Dentipellis fragilis TaxID=205917 RepID=A0A4Y9Y5S6_9AGAM|nr:hypothetical protein EVG20_g8612 [Dentipellis fragilis]
MAHFSSLLSLPVLLPSILSVQGVVVPSEDGPNIRESALSDTTIASQIVASATELASSLAPAFESSGILPTGLPLPGVSGLPGILPGGSAGIPFADSSFPAAVPSNFAYPPLGSDAPIPTASHHSFPLPKELRDEDSNHLAARKAKSKASANPKATSKSAAKTTMAATTSAKTTKAATSAKTTKAATSVKTTKAATSSKASKTSKAATASAETTSKAAASSHLRHRPQTSPILRNLLVTSSAACNLKRAGTAGVAARADCQTCDPCDDACDSNVSEVSTRRRAVEDAAAAANVRVLYGNDSTPFLPDEHVRVRMIEGRANPVLEFDCTTNGIPDVCQNMCYGVHCHGHPQTLTRNTGNKKTCAAARKQNSCGASPNRCSAKKGAPAGQSCDEYPFASSKEGQEAGTGGKTSAVTRCVPARQNSSQGGKISGIYRSIADGTQYDIKFDFAGAAGTDYCSPAAKSQKTGCNTLTGSQSNN